METLVLMYERVSFRGFSRLGSGSALLIVLPWGRSILHGLSIFNLIVWMNQWKHLSLISQANSGLVDEKKKTNRVDAGREK